MVSGCDTKAGQGITTCIKSTGIPHWMGLLNRCMMRWLLDIVYDHHAFRSLRLLLFLQSSANVRTQSNFMTRRSNFPWSWGRFAPLAGSWRQHTRQRGQIHLFSLWRAWCFAVLQECFLNAGSYFGFVSFWVYNIKSNYFLLLCWEKATWVTRFSI
mgnify:CR=1 FL=1